LAHARDFVDEDWPPLVRLARRAEALARSFD
jgi:hypothetical protein